MNQVAKIAAINRTMTPSEWGMLIALSVLWGGSFFFNGVALQELPPLTLVFLRVALAALILLPVLLQLNLLLVLKMLNQLLLNLLLLLLPSQLLHQRNNFFIFIIVFCIFFPFCFNCDNLMYLHTLSHTSPLLTTISSYINNYINQSSYHINLF